MDWLPTLVEKVSSFYGVIILLIIMIIGYVLLRTGILQIKTKNIQLGKSDIEENERKIMRQQISFLRVSAEGLTSEFSKYCNNIWRVKYAISKMCDVLEEAILHNHIERGDEKYIAIKQKLVYNAVIKRIKHSHFQSEEFKDYSDRFTRDMLNEFVNIREVYGGE